MPPMPPPCGIAGGVFFSGFSATIASVVTSRPATEAAFCNASRTTLVGSMMPALTISTYSPLWASKPRFGSFASSSRPTTIDHSVPAFSATWRTGVCSALRTMSIPTFWSVVFGRQPVECLGGIEEGDAATRDDAFLDRRSRGVGGVVDPVLSFLHLDLGGAADADHRDAACELRQPLLQLLAVIIRGR